MLSAFWNQRRSEKSQERLAVPPSEVVSVALELKSGLGTTMTGNMETLSMPSKVMFWPISHNNYRDILVAIGIDEIAKCKEPNKKNAAYG